MNADIAITQQDLNDVCRMLEMIPRIDPGSCPSAADKATALALYRKLRGALAGGDRLAEVFEALRKDGQGLTLGQELFIKEKLR